jgi:hypothetical protein
MRDCASEVWCYAPSRNDDGCESSFSRHEMSELLKATRPRKCRGRREGRVPTAPMVRVQQKARGRTTGTGGSSGLPCAMAYGLYALSPVTMLFCHRHPRDAESIFANLSACIGAPRPHDFAVRTNAACRAKKAPGDMRPSHPAANVRDDRETPLCKAAGWPERCF